MTDTGCGDLKGLARGEDVVKGGGGMMDGESRSRCFILLGFGTLGLLLMGWLFAGQSPSKLTG